MTATSYVANYCKVENVDKGEHCITHLFSVIWRETFSKWPTNKTQILIKFEGENLGEFYVVISHDI